MTIVTLSLLCELNTPKLGRNCHVFARMAMTGVLPCAINSHMLRREAAQMARMYDSNVGVPVGADRHYAFVLPCHFCATNTHLLQWGQNLITTPYQSKPPLHFAEEKALMYRDE